MLRQTSRQEYFSQPKSFAACHDNSCRHLNSDRESDLPQNGAVLPRNSLARGLAWLQISQGLQETADYGAAAPPGIVGPALQPLDVNAGLGTCKVRVEHRFIRRHHSGIQQTRRAIEHTAVEYEQLNEPKGRAAR